MEKQQFSPVIQPLNHRQVRQQIAEQWLSIPPEQLATAYSGDTGKAHQALLNSGIKDEPLNDTEQIFVERLAAQIARGFDDPKAINYLLAAMLYRRADQLPLQYESAYIIPSWFFNDYLKFMLSSPSYFHDIGEVEDYYKHMQQFLDFVHTNIFSNRNSKYWQNIALVLVQNANFIHLYFSIINLKDIYTKRADIIEFTLKNLGHQIDYIFPDRPSHRNKICLGILNFNFTPHTETFATLPIFEYLNREKFEIILYAINVNNHPLDLYCQNCADQLVKLPKNLPDCVRRIRADDLDILLIGTNVTAVTNNITLLAIHRLARVQVTSVSSPVTTGMRNIDYYISGDLTEYVQDAQQQYREQILTIDGTAHCFSYTMENEAYPSRCNRETIGIPEQSLVFISSASFYKIIPELRQTWAKILAAVPNSVLCLFPFNPSWNNSYPKTQFIDWMRSVFAKYGVEKDRLIFVDALPNRAELKKFLKVGDIYLDSYPYTGSTSLVDPLEIGLPTIVMDGSSFGNSLRSRQAAALLRELQIPDLIADSEEAYIKLAINLATNPELREVYREQITQKMQRKPRFLDSRSYSNRIGTAFEKLFQEWQRLDTEKQASLTNQSAANELQEKPIDSPQFLNLLSGCVNLYEIDPSDESVLAELRLIRKRIADFWLNAAVEELESLYLGNVGKAHQILLNSGFKEEQLTEAEQTFVDELAANRAKRFDAPKDINYRLAAMLYCRGNQLLLEANGTCFSEWLE
ncbi:hypothetical protein [Argonema antarcticum]|uniref:O-linked N-acetylglucosamine transferase, SPINDLY family protein n=1 Tax=Argonema antarcticum TaxID=2942763 RepID=UPI00201302B5|nr:hypothetical protein [Argonema antarcticum]MCL1472244.1 hypothetical protein [Argonema antarcticum A004/B2]